MERLLTHGLEPQDMVVLDRTAASELLTGGLGSYGGMGSYSGMGSYGGVGSYGGLVRIHIHGYALIILRYDRRDRPVCEAARRAWWDPKPFSVHKMVKGYACWSTECNGGF